MTKPDATDVLAAAPALSPALLGYSTGIMPADDNVVTLVIDDAWDFMTEHVGPPPAGATPATQEERNWKRAHLWLTLAWLHVEVIKSKAPYIGHVSGRAGQVNIPASAMEPLWRVVSDYYARLLQLYPLLPLPVLQGAAEGGQVVVQRVYN